MRSLESFGSSASARSRASCSCCARPSVRDVRDVKTRQLTPEVFKFKAEIALDEDHLSRLIEDARKESTRACATAAVHAIAAEIQAIEGAVRAAIPQANHIDLEIVDPTPAE